MDIAGIKLLVQEFENAIEREDVTVCKKKSRTLAFYFFEASKNMPEVPLKEIKEVATRVFNMFLGMQRPELFNKIVMISAKQFVDTSSFYIQNLIGVLINCFPILKELSKSDEGQTLSSEIEKETKKLLNVDSTIKKLEEHLEERKDLYKHLYQSNVSLRMNPDRQGVINFGFITYNSNLGLENTINLIKKTFSHKILKEEEISNILTLAKNYLMQFYKNAHEMMLENSNIEGIQIVSLWLALKDQNSKVLIDHFIAALMEAKLIQIEPKEFARIASNLQRLLTDFLKVIHKTTLTQRFKKISQARFLPRLIADPKQNKIFLEFEDPNKKIYPIQCKFIPNNSEKFALLLNKYVINEKPQEGSYLVKVKDAAVKLKLSEENVREAAESGNFEQKVLELRAIQFRKAIQEERGIEVQHQGFKSRAKDFLELNPGLYQNVPIYYSEGDVFLDGNSVLKQGLKGYEICPIFIWKDGESVYVGFEDSLQVNLIEEVFEGNYQSSSVFDYDAKKIRDNEIIRQCKELLMAENNVEMKDVQSLSSINVI